MTAATPVRLMRNREGQLELVFINTAPSRREWWLDAYTLAEQHNQISKAYLRTLRPVPVEGEALELLRHWQALPPAGEVRVVRRFTPPAGFVYVGL